MSAENRENFIKVKPFDGTGYGNSEFRMKLLLEYNEVLDIISEEKPSDTSLLSAWKKTDLRARNLIVQCLCDNVLEMIKSKKTAKDIMSTLKSTYEKSGVASQVQLQRKLRNMRYNPESSLNEYIVEFEKTIAELKNAGGNINDMEVISQLLASISEPQYQSVVTAIDVLLSQSGSTITLDFVKSKLLAEEQRHTTNCEGTSNNSTAFYGGEKNKKKFIFKCYSCGKTGHKKSECRSKKNENKKTFSKANVTENDEEISFITCLSSENLEDKENIMKFVVDSGCTNHLIKSEYEKFLTDKKQVNHSIKVAKKGHSVEAKVKGTLHLETGTGLKIKLENILLCKNLTHNLLCVKKIENRGLKIIFENSKISVKQSNGNEVISGHLQGGLYVVDLHIISERANLTSIEEKELWHIRMGHSSYFPSGKVCDICIKGKQTRKPFKSLPDERKAKNILDCISSDVCGPMNPVSHNGKRYFITFIDHFSHFGVVYYTIKVNHSRNSKNI